MSRIFGNWSRFASSQQSGQQTRPVGFTLAIRHDYFNREEFRRQGDLSGSGEDAMVETDGPSRIYSSCQNPARYTPRRSGYQDRRVDAIKRDRGLVW